jgi:hypothetical protein
LVASLKHLDGSPLFFTDGNRGSGYGMKYECKKAVQSPFSDGLPRSDAIATSEWNEVSEKWRVKDRSGTPSSRRVCISSIYSKKTLTSFFLLFLLLLLFLLFFQVNPTVRSGKDNDSIVSASSTMIESMLQDEALSLPWKKCPFPIPKDRKGRDMYDAPPSPPKPSKTSNRIKKSKNKNDNNASRISAALESPLRGGRAGEFILDIIVYSI